MAEQLLDVSMSADPDWLREERSELLWECTRDRHHWAPRADVKEAFVARLRDIAGNLFRPAGIQPEWLAWNGGQVPRLSRAVCDVRRFTEVPCLADALEDAGCDDEVIFGHLRPLNSPTCPRPYD